MDGLIQLFDRIFVYPTLSIFITFYQHVNNFALALLLFSSFIYILLTWPSAYIDEFLQRKEREARAMAGELAWALYPWRYRPMSVRRSLILSSSVIILSTLKIYLNIGLYFSLALLGGSSLVSLNGILYPFVPHLSALPDYTLTFLGETTSLVQRNFLPTFLPIMAFYSLVDAYLRANVIVRAFGGRNRWSTIVSLSARTYLMQLVFALVLCWLLASGIFLIFATEGILHIPVRIYMLKRSKV
ncbi:MAG TPA: hypothetical protein VFB60_12770 [Ktedonobacteraceae bacterium]|nr:hypothetical protein [Ktedonobacteraceae bacterium]